MWLTQSQKNEVMNCNINDDFYKFLIDGSGRLIGAFAPSVDPMSSAIQNAVAN
jgi:glutathione peroxidase-family protein